MVSTEYCLLIRTVSVLYYFCTSTVSVMYQYCTLYTLQCTVYITNTNYTEIKIANIGKRYGIGREIRKMREKAQTDSSGALHNTRVCYITRVSIALHACLFHNTRVCYIAHVFVT